MRTEWTPIVRAASSSILAALILLAASAAALAGNVTYNYDSLGRLKSVTYADGTTINYTLDPTGNRQTVASATTAGVLQLTAVNASVAENGGSIVLTVSRSGGSTGAVAVSYATSNGTATAGRRSCVCRSTIRTPPTAAATWIRAAPTRWSSRRTSSRRW